MRAAVADLENSLPVNVKITVSVDDSIFIEAAVNEVIKSLLFATLIVVAVIFLFLRSLRATLIPAVTIPISLFGTVAAIYLAGFSVNLITLLGLVVASGLVVDDAVVVTENIQRWRAKGAGKRAAAILGTREIIFAVLATTVTLAAVFIPISFLPGQAGKLFSEFGFVLAFAVMVSSFIALILCPVLTVLLGRAHRKEMDSVSNEQAMPEGPLSKVYGPPLRFVLHRPIAVSLASLLFAAGAVVTFSSIPTELTPEEDRGSISMLVFGQAGTSFQYLDRKVLEVEHRLQGFVDEGFGRSVISVNGVGGSSRSFAALRLPEWSERDFTQAEVERRVRAATSNIPGVSVIIRRGNSLGIRGAGEGLRFAVVGDQYAQVATGADALADAMRSLPEFSDVRTDFQTSQPQITIDIDREAASALDIPISAITRTIQVLADEFRAAEIFVGDDVVEVMMSGAGEPVNDPTDLANIFLRASNGDFVPLSSLATVREVAVASNLAREQRRRAVPVSAELAEGVRLGDAVSAMRTLSGEVLEGLQSVTLLGEAKVLQDSNRSTMLVFAFAGLIVFLVLAAQFESFVSAFVIMITVPFGLAAAVYAIAVTGGSFNYYSQIGLVLLIGIMAKNGILIVEFANLERDRGKSVAEAIEFASMVRLRPVLMTAISTLLASLPLILGAGAGAESRAALGWVIFGGLGFATFFTLFLVPVAFRLFAGIARPRASEGMKVADELATAPSA